jgi:hypothetical protein
MEATAGKVLVAVEQFQVDEDAWWHQRERERERETYIWWAYNGSVPMRESDVIGLLQAVADHRITKTLFALFKLLQQTEVSWYCDSDKQLPVASWSQ